MKKTIQLTLLLIALLSFSSNKALAYDIAVENDDGVIICYNYTSGGTALAVTYLYSDYDSNRYTYTGNVVVPEEVTHNDVTRKVTSIGNKAFAGCSDLTSVTIPSSVTSIGREAFYECKGLTSVTIPNSVTSIEWCAFADCDGLSSIDIPNSVKTIGGRAFSGCNELTSVTIGNSVTSIGGGAFEGCFGLTSINIPNSVISIGDYAFYLCRGLTSAIIGNGVTNIGIFAFSYCSSLTSLTIGNSVTTIGQSAFSYCSSLTSITIPNSITQICTQAFDNCSSLSSVTIPESVTHIGDGAFLCCSNLISVTIPNSVTYIGGYAFQDCTSLTSITIPNSVTYIGSCAFVGCSGLLSVISKVETPFSIDGKNTNYRTFDLNTYNNATLYVPKGTINKYKGTLGWRDFLNIITEGSYTLTYIVDEEEYQTVIVDEGETINPIDEPIKEGYSFSGWSEIPSTMPSHDVTIRGTFTVNKYKVIYMVDGAEYETTEVEYGSTVTVEAEPTKEGYTFSGWSDIPATMPAKDVIVTGTFTVNKYKLIYTIDGKEYKTVEVEYGSTITPEQTPEGDYVTFEWIGIPETMPAHDVTVTATYTTGINSIPISRDEDNKGVNYNLNGQRIEGQPSQKGVYIKNGKKVLMK